MKLHFDRSDPRIQSLFQKSPDLLARKRISIARRALAAREQNPLSNAQVKRIIRARKFELCGNRFTLYNRSGEAKTGQIITAIKHLAPIPDKAYAGIWIESQGRDVLDIEVIATEAASTFPEYSSEIGQIQGALFSLEFCLLNKAVNYPVSEKHLWIRRIGSNINGLGGKALSALYNIAKDLKFDLIRFSVAPSNLRARQFYFHMDFGAPTDALMERWELKIR